MKLCHILDNYVQVCFPQKRHKIRPRDPPWINTDVRRKQRRKRRTYKKEGRSARYYSQRKEVDDLILRNKKQFVAKVKNKVKNGGDIAGYYHAVK